MPLETRNSHKKGHKSDVDQQIVMADSDSAKVKSDATPKKQKATVAVPKKGCGETF